jgi:hypothetical protein
MAAGRAALLGAAWNALREVRVWGRVDDATSRSSEWVSEIESLTRAEVEKPTPVASTYSPIRRPDFLLHEQRTRDLAVGSRVIDGLRDCGHALRVDDVARDRFNTVGRHPLAAARGPEEIDSAHVHLRQCAGAGKCVRQWRAMSIPRQNHTSLYPRIYSRSLMSPAARPGRPISRSCRPIENSFGEPLAPSR